MLRENITNLLCECILMDINDPAIYDVWDQITELLSSDVNKTITYLSECNEQELYYLSSVLEDVSVNVNCQEYINILKGLSNKFPALELESIVKLAEKMI